MLHIEINFITFLLVLMSFIISTNAIYETVNVKIRNGDEIIDLHWKQTGQYLANKNLPVWYAQKRKEPHILPNVMEEIGDIITYHDVEKSSAVVYFKKFNYFYGVVDTRFHIIGLPLGNVGRNVYLDVGGSYVIARDKNEYHFHDGVTEWLSNLFSDSEMQLINSLIDSGNIPASQSSNQDQNDNNIPGTSAQDESISVPKNVHEEFALLRHPGVQVLYPEVIVFVTNDIYTKFTHVDSNRGINVLVMYYIIYFNAVDMLLAKLATGGITIHTNIAGIVIEAQHRAFPYMVDKIIEKDSSVSYRLRASLFSFRFPQYLSKYRNIFSEDSFDFVFISTGYQIQKHGEIYQGLFRPVVDVYRQRYLGQPYENLLGVIVQSKNDFDDYVGATRDIAQLLGVDHDPSSEGLFDENKQCYAIMQKTESHCRNCLKWSEKSQNELKTYVRFNRNHCFLLNYPRSLYPYGQPIFSMNPEDQCICYQFPIATLDVFYMITIPENSCDKPMKCSFNQQPETLTPLPLDGTPCNGFNQVCWQRKCVAASQ